MTFFSCDFRRIGYDPITFLRCFFMTANLTAHGSCDKLRACYTQFVSARRIGFVRYSRFKPKVS